MNGYIDECWIAVHSGIGDSMVGVHCRMNERLIAVAKNFMEGRPNMEGRGKSPK